MNETVDKDIEGTDKGESKLVAQIVYERICGKSKTITIGHIPSDKKLKYDLICTRYSIPKSENIDMVNQWIAVCEVLFSMADRHHRDPLSFKNEMMDAILYVVSSFDKKGMMEKAVINDVVVSMDAGIKDELRKSMKNFLGAEF